SRPFQPLLTFKLVMTTCILTYCYAFSTQNRLDNLSKSLEVKSPVPIVMSLSFHTRLKGIFLPYSNTLSMVCFETMELEVYFEECMVHIVYSFPFVDCCVIVFCCHIKPIEY